MDFLLIWAMKIYIMLQITTLYCFDIVHEIIMDSFRVAAGHLINFGMHSSAMNHQCVHSALCCYSAEVYFV
jgi:hypothetical protein